MNAIDIKSRVIDVGRILEDGQALLKLMESLGWDNFRALEALQGMIAIFNLEVGIDYATTEGFARDIYRAVEKACAGVPRE